MELILTWGLGLSVLALLVYAWSVERIVCRRVHPDFRRDLALAGADTPDDLGVWLKQHIWNSRQILPVLIGIPAALVIVHFALPDHLPRWKLLGALIVAYGHFALSVQVCAATVLFFGIRACRNNRESAGGGFVVASCVGAITPLIFMVLLTLGFPLLESIVGYLQAAQVLPSTVRAVERVGEYLIVGLALTLQGAALFLTLPYAQRMFARAYPWQE